MDNSELLDDKVAENIGFTIPPLPSRSSFRDLTNRNNPWGKEEAPSNPQTGWKAKAKMPKELHDALDNPAGLPSIFHPFISNGPLYIPGKGDSPIINFKLEFPNQHDVKRRVWFHLGKENFIVGGICAILIGTRNASIPSRLLYALVHQQAMPKPRLKGTGFQMTIPTFFGRFVMGGLFFDAVKRNHERDSLQFRDDTFNRLKNAGIAGGICGFVLGLRGGLKYAWLTTMLYSGTGVLAEFAPNITSTIKKAVETNLK